MYAQVFTVIIIIIVKCNYTEFEYFNKHEIHEKYEENQTLLPADGIIL